MNASGGEIRDDTRLSRASEWFVRLREPTITTDEIAAWLAWCKEHPGNERAYRQVQEMWSLAGDAGVADWPDVAKVRADTYDGDVAVAEWNARQGVEPKSESLQSPEWQSLSLRSTSPQSPSPQSPARQTATRGSVDSPAGRGRGVKSREWARPAVAAAASLLLGVSLWTFRDSWLPAPDSGVFSTERGGQRTVRLADGSRVILGGASAVRIDFQGDRRDVELERGEAFFKVARDPARPFVVHAQDVRVTAVGTAFSVRADDVRTVVSVTEGVVDVAPTGTTAAPTPAAPAPASEAAGPAASTEPNGSAPTIGALEVQPRRVLRARAGEQVTYDVTLRASVLQPGDIAVALGWQEGALTYVDEPLRSVVARVNRYSKQEIVVADGIDELRFTGTVLEDQIAEWATGLERVFPIRVVAREDGSLLLEPR